METRKTEELTVSFAETARGWRVVLRFADGSGHVSDDAFATREECQAAFDAWVEATGIRFTRAH